MSLTLSTRSVARTQVPYGSLTLHFAGVFTVGMFSVPSIRIFTWRPGDGHLNFAKDLFAKSVLQGVSSLDWTTDIFVGAKIVSEVRPGRLHADLVC